MANTRSAKEIREAIRDLEVELEAKREQKVLPAYVELANGAYAEQFQNEQRANVKKLEDAIAILKKDLLELEDAIAILREDLLEAEEREAELNPPAQETCFDHYEQAKNHFEKVLAYWYAVYFDQLNADGTEVAFAAFDPKMVSDETERFPAENSSEVELVRPPQSQSLRDVLQSDKKCKDFGDFTDAKKEWIGLINRFLKSVHREFIEAQRELNKPNFDLHEQGRRSKKIHDLTILLQEVGSYAEKVMYNKATQEDHEKFEKRKNEQKNPVLKNTMRGLLGIGLIIVGVGMILGSILLAAGLTKSVVGAPLAFKVAKVSITLGIKAINTGVAVTTAAAGLGVTYAGSSLFANAIKYSTPKDFMGVLHKARPIMPVKLNDDPAYELANRVAYRR